MNRTPPASAATGTPAQACAVGVEAPAVRRLPGSLCAAMALQFATGGAVIPFITLLFRERGLDLRQVSLIFSGSSATLLVFPFLWGMLADRFLPLNRLFGILNLLAAAALVFLARQRGFGGLLAGFVAYYACFYPTLYLLNSLSFHHLPDPRGQFGKLRAWGSLGWIVPFAPISLWLARGPEINLNVTLYLGVSCALGMSALSFWLPDTPPGARQEAAVRQSPYRAALKALLTNGNYLVLLFSMFLMSGSFSILTYYSPALLQDVGVPRPWIGPIQAIAVLFEIVLFQWQAALLRRWNYLAVIVGGCVALLLRHLVFAEVSNAWVLAASYLFAGVVIVFYYQAVSLLANAIAAREVRSTAQTLLLFLGQGMGPLLANLICGHLGRTGPGALRNLFLFAALLAGLAASLLLARGRQLNHLRQAA